MVVPAGLSKKEELYLDKHFNKNIEKGVFWNLKKKKLNKKQIKLEYGILTKPHFLLE